MNGGYSGLDGNFSCGVGGLDPGGEQVKSEPSSHHRALYPSSVSHPHQGGENYLITITL